MGSSEKNSYPNLVLRDRNPGRVRKPHPWVREPVQHRFAVVGVPLVEFSHGIRAVGEARTTEQVDPALSRRREFEKAVGGSSSKSPES